MSWNLISNVIVSFSASFVAVLVSLWIERKRLPKIDIVVGEDANSDNTYSSPNAHAGERWKFFRVRVINHKFPIPLSWISRQTAENCTAEVTFTKVGATGRIMSMKGRWASTLELAYLPAEQAFIKVLFPDPVSIIPGASETLDIFTKYEEDKEAYGWNNESYAHNWRHPGYILERGQYEIKVKITTQNGIRAMRIFRCQIADKIENTTLVKY